MHEGGWEPFVHHFSSVLEGVVPQDEETRAGGEAPRPPGHGRKNAGDLVQRERRNKGWRDFVHQVARRPAPLVTPRRRPFIRKFINFRMIIKVY